MLRLATLQRALAECDVAGVASNLDLLHRIAMHPDSPRAVSTPVSSRAMPIRCWQGKDAPPDDVLAAAALAVLTDEAAIACAPRRNERRSAFARGTRATNGG